jgi:hypothetical protein
MGSRVGPKVCLWVVDVSGRVLNETGNIATYEEISRGSAGYPGTCADLLISGMNRYRDGATR